MFTQPEVIPSWPPLPLSPFQYWCPQALSSFYSSPSPPGHAFSPVLTTMLQWSPPTSLLSSRPMWPTARNRPLSECLPNPSEVPFPKLIFPSPYLAPNTPTAELVTGVLWTRRLPLPSEALHKLFPLSRIPFSPLSTLLNPYLFLSTQPTCRFLCLVLMSFPCPWSQREFWSFLLGSQLSIRLRVLIPTRLWATEEAVSFQLCFPALSAGQATGRHLTSICRMELDRDPNSLKYQFLLLPSQAHLRSKEKDSNAQSLNNTDIVITNIISHFTES